MKRLTAALGDTWEPFAADPGYWHRYEQVGQLDDDWRYFFHGYGCGFGNQRTGQTVEVHLGFPGEFGVLDPYFFAEFVRTTAGLEEVASLFKDPCRDSLRAMKILHSRGLLHYINDGWGIDGDL